ncbi:hypothetical protein GCM10026982_07100 [Nocardiopsis aegyptia]
MRPRMFSSSSSENQPGWVSAVSVIGCAAERPTARAPGAAGMRPPLPPFDRSASLWDQSPARGGRERTVPYRFYRTPVGPRTVRARIRVSERSGDRQG